jgi:hypothetical protein
LAGPNESYLIGRVRSEALKPAFSVIIKTLHPLLAQDLGSNLAVLLKDISALVVTQSKDSGLFT